MICKCRNNNHNYIIRLLRVMGIEWVAKGAKVPLYFLQFLRKYVLNISTVYFILMIEKKMTNLGGVKGGWG